MHPRASGRLSAVYAGAAGLPAATVDAGALTVGSWTPVADAAATAASSWPAPATGSPER